MSRFQYGLKALGELEGILESKGELDEDVNIGIHTDDSNKSYLVVKVENVTYSFDSSLLKIVFDYDSNLLPNICKYIERRKKKREFYNMLEKVA